MTLTLRLDSCPPKVLGQMAYWWWQRLSGSARQQTDFHFDLTLLRVRCSKELFVEFLDWIEANLPSQRQFGVSLDPGTGSTEPPY